MDVLDKLLSFAQIKGSVDVQCLLQGNWLVRHEAHRGQARLHIVTQGQGYLRIDGQSDELLNNGDVIFFPRAIGHQLGKNQTNHQPIEPIRTRQQGVFTIKEAGEQHSDMTLFCGTFHYDEKSDLMNRLPECIRLNLQHHALSPLITLIRDEARHSAQGSHSMINALSMVLLTLIIRRHLAEEKSGTGILYAWQDKRLSTLIDAIVCTPHLPWKVEDMLSYVTLSRAQLMRLFRQHLHSTPHTFVTQIRLQQAALLLNNSAQNIIQIALNVGFQSESHFVRLFRQYYGQTPKTYRQRDKN